MVSTTEIAPIPQGKISPNTNGQGKRVDIRKFLKQLMSRYRQLSAGVISGKEFDYFGQKINPTTSGGVYKVDLETQNLDNHLKVALTTYNIDLDATEQIRNAIIS